jgi:hypothetical protein
VTESGTARARDVDAALGQEPNRGAPADVAVFLKTQAPGGRRVRGADAGAVVRARARDGGEADGAALGHVARAPRSVWVDTRRIDVDAVDRQMGVRAPDRPGTRAS